MDKPQHTVQISFVMCRSCRWTMRVTRDGCFYCYNPECDDQLKAFKPFITMAEVPIEQLTEIPGVSNG